MIRETIDRARHQLAAGGGGHIMIIWGIAWVLGYSATHLLENHLVGYLWAIVNSTTGIASYITGRMYGSKVKGHSENRIWGLWMALFGFGILWIWLLGINTSNDMDMFFGSLAMFGYVVVGLMLASRFLVGRDWRSPDCRLRDMSCSPSTSRCGWP